MMTLKELVFTSSVLLMAVVGFGQNKTPGAAETIKVDNTKSYKLNLKAEIPVLVASGAFVAYNFAQISKKTESDPAYVVTLSKNNVNWFDRWGVRAYNEKMDNASYIPFFISMPLPLVVFLIDKKMRKDFFKLSFLYAEAMTATGVLYGSASNFTNRLRPMVFSAETPLDKRTSSFSRKSFFAGHVALVATSTFLVARIYADYHPDSKLKWLFYGVAGAATFATAYMRQAAGEHFLSDILVGTAVGVGSGLLTPALHRHKSNNNQRLSILPFAGQNNGVALLYKL